MEIDNKIEDDWELINKLNTMGTRDKEDLLSQFQSIVGTQMSPGCCSFYLEMGNWNLQTALGAYYDLSATETLPNIEVMTESFHIGENSVKPGEPFVKSWTFKNTGTEPWPALLKLKFVEGYRFEHGVQCPIPSIGPGEVIEVRLPMIAPDEVGLYHNKWRPVTVSGAYFGSTLYVSVSVVDSKDITNLTEQFNTTFSHLKNNEHLPNGVTSEPISTPIRTQVAATPFCSPTGYGIFGGGTPTHSSTVSTLPTIRESHSQPPQRSFYIHGQTNSHDTNLNYNSSDALPVDVFNDLRLNPDHTDTDMS